jgi:nicotinate-nucleotide adenylyltransferase
MHIGLFFGSFNPIHHGHLIIASIARHATHLQQVWLVVSPQNPFKPGASLLNEYDRLHLVQLAIADDPSLRVTDVEFHLPKPSFTVHTLAYLQEKHPQHKFSIILGSDSLSNLPDWKNADVIIQNHALYVYERPGFPILPPPKSQVIPFEAPLLQISSTSIRAFIQKKIPIRYLVPSAVAEEIERNRYYQ